MLFRLSWLFGFTGLVFGFALAGFAIENQASQTEDEACFGPNCVYFIDTDGGYQPEIPGCTRRAGNAQCDNSTQRLIDTCAVNILVEEFGPAACTENGGTSTEEIDCNEWCDQEYGQTGTCVYSDPLPECDNEQVAYCACSDKQAVKGSSNMSSFTANGFTIVFSRLAMILPVF